ncbi:MAG TPA: stimulus-sensing domain-containing protein [Afifellaceae bacterium]|nr:stimulus-sensing domain-containing protein [Afifellaceae bacterium]
MVAETENRQPQATESGSALRTIGRLALRGVAPAAALARWLSQIAVSSLTRRILILNLAALIALVGGILYLNKFRAGLIDARVESLRTQGQIIAAAIAAQASVETDSITVDPDKLLELQAGESLSPFDLGDSTADFPINPERVAPLLKRLISPTRIRGRIYDQEGTLLLDSRGLYSRGQILRFELPPLDQEKPWYDGLSARIKHWFRRGDLPAYREIGAGNGREYPEVVNALNGQSPSIVRISEDGGLIVSVAVPIQRFRAVLGALLLSTESGDIDAIVEAERMAIVRVFLVAAAVTILLSVLLASTIAGPVRRLSGAAERVRRGVKRRVEIPDFSGRKDEIGHLAQSLRDMTTALYNRMEAIESFAADVAHELKNPLTSLRSAVETLPIVKTQESRARLLAVIQHDVRRLDRLITDISDASRLDAELARADTEPVDIARLLDAVVTIAREARVVRHSEIVLAVDSGRWGKNAFYVLGHDSRLAQVFNNLIDNARSFSPPNGIVRVVAKRHANAIVVTVDDDGPGINGENIDRIFERFYTDRPDAEDFGKNSGLGLAITRQIVDVHRGRVTAENRRDANGRITGARFTVVLPPAGRK